MKQRRTFLKKTTLASAALMGMQVAPFNIISAKPTLNKDILGHGDFKYRVEKEWGDLDPKKYPVNNCHEMVMDKQGRLLLLTDHVKNNILIYDKAGKLLDSWTLDLRGAHGLTLQEEGGTEYLYITDAWDGKVVKATLDGKKVMDFISPIESGVYDKPTMRFAPTETAIAPNGDVYIADGYGSQFILHYDAKGNFINKFGGDSFLQPDKFKQAHGVALDTRGGITPTLICTARIKNTFKRFSLAGEHLEDIYIPGAFLSRPVIKGDNLYSGVCFGMLEDDYNVHMNKGFVTILDKNNQVVSNPGGTKPKYKNGKLQRLLQEQPVF